MRDLGQGKKERAALAPPFIRNLAWGSDEIVPAGQDGRDGGIDLRITIEDEAG